MMLNDSEDETTQGEVERWWQSATLICTMPPGFESPFEPLRARCALSVGILIGRRSIA